MHNIEEEMMLGGCGDPLCPVCGGMSVGIDTMSGNPSPPGSGEMKVRDDIPAVLSDGEYVVPADVVRYHGLKTFMALRDEAKFGLMSMYAEGQIQDIEDEYLDEETHTMPDGTEMPGATHEEYAEDDYECCGEEDCDCQYEDEEMPNYKDTMGEMTDLNYDGQEDYETEEGNVVEKAQPEIEEETMEVEEEETSSDGKNTYRPRVKFAVMKR